MRSAFDMGAGCLGNGVTFWNRASIVDGDYETVAHVSEAGNICWRIPREDFPDKDRARVERTAAEYRKKWEADFNRRDALRQYSFLLDCAPCGVALDCGAYDGNLPLEERIARLKAAVLPRL